jgi:DNA-binding transcriptional LysR family regulator
MGVIIMNFEQLEYIKEVIDTKSMSIAANNLHVSQSAISQSISLLEKEFGVQIFKRSRLGTIPTEEGKTIIKKIMEILKKADELREEVHSLTSTYNGELHVATSPSIFMAFLPKALARFREDYPQINVMIKEMESQEIMKEVEQKKADLGLITLFNNGEEMLPKDITLQSFRHQGRFNVIVPNHSELALNQELQLMDVKEYPFVLYDRSFYNNLIEDFEKHYGPLNIIFRTTNSEVVKKTVSEGLGIALMTSLMIKDDPYLESGRILAIPLSYPFNFNLSVGGIYYKNRNQYGLIKKFLEYVEI